MWVGLGSASLGQQGCVSQYNAELNSMKNQQIQKYAALISKYENRKKSSRMTASQHPNAEISSFSQTIDSSIFRHVIQQKIKTKYLQPKFLKTQLDPSPHSLHLESLSKIPERKLKTDESFKEEKQKPQIVKENENSILKVNNLAVLNNRSPIFINTSNLLTLGSPKSIKHRRQTMQSKKSACDYFKYDLNMGVSVIKKLKRPVQKSDKLQKMIRYGYQLDGSIFHFQHANVKTLPSQIEEMKEKEIISVKAERQRIYQVLKSTSPLVVTPKILKTTLAKDKTAPRDTVLCAPHKFLNKKKYVKSQRFQNKDVHAQFKAASMYLKESSKKKNVKKPEAITAWEYEQDF